MYKSFILGLWWCGRVKEEQEWGYLVKVEPIDPKTQCDWQGRAELDMMPVFGAWQIEILVLLWREKKSLEIWRKWSSD